MSGNRDIIRYRKREREREKNVIIDYVYKKQNNTNK